ncbi:MAG: hypothetical protein JWR12_2074 [Mucilaginibacter sp.]|nr:hypothetical protein [Mucilaginibacter sp.]
MKKLILIVSFIAGLGALANAQALNTAAQHKLPEQRAAHITKVMQKRFNLSQEQAQQVNAAFVTQATRMDSLRNNPSANKKENHLAARGIMLGTEKQVVAILNPTQKEQFMTWVKMRKPKRMEKQEAEIPIQ